MNIFSKKNREKRASFIGRRTSKAPPPPANISLFSEPEQPTIRPHSQIISNNSIPNHYSRFQVAENSPYLTSSQPGGSSLHAGSSLGSSWVSSTYQVNSANSNNKTEYYLHPHGNNLNNANSINNATTNIPRRKPPPKSPSDYDKSRFDSIDNLSDTSLTRKDSMARRRSIRKADTKNKSLPLLPPDIHESSTEASASLERSSGRSSIGLPNAETIDQDLDAPLSSATSANFNNGYARSQSLRAASTAHASGSLGINRSTAYPQGQTETFKRDTIITDDLAIPRRSAKRISTYTYGVGLSKDLTSSNGFGDTVSNKHSDEPKIPPRSERRLSLFLPFTNKPPKEPTFSVISSKKVDDPPNLSPAKQQLMDGQQLDSHTPSARVSSKQETQPKFPSSSINRLSFIPPAGGDFGVLSKNEQIDIPDNVSSPNTSAQPLNALLPISNDMPLNNIMQDLWNPVQKLNKYETEEFEKRNSEFEQFLKTTNASQLDKEISVDVPKLPEYRKPEIITTLEKSRYSEAPQPSATGKYQIDDSVLNFGDSFNVNSMLKEIDETENGNIQTKKELRDRLERTATINLNKILSKYHKNKQYDQEATIHREINLISDYSRNVNHNNNQNHDQNNEAYQHSDVSEYDHLLESELQKYRLINEYLSRKNSQYSLSKTEKDLTKTPPQSQLASSFDSPSYININASHIVRTDFSNKESGRARIPDSTNEFENASDTNTEIYSQKDGNNSDSTLGESSKFNVGGSIGNDCGDLSSSQRSFELVIPLSQPSGESSSTKEDGYDGHQGNTINKVAQQSSPDAPNDPNVGASNFQEIGYTQKQLQKGHPTQATGYFQDAAFKTQQIQSSDAYSTFDRASINITSADFQQQEKDILPNGTIAELNNKQPVSLPNSNFAREIRMSSSAAISESMRRSIMTRVSQPNGVDRADSVHTINSVQTAQTAQTSTSVFTGSSALSPEETITASLDHYDQTVETDSDDTINIINFSSSSLKPHHFKQCHEVWSLSGIFKWLLKFEKWFEDQVIRKKEVVKSLELLLKYYYPKMKSIMIFEVISVILEEFKAEHALIHRIDSQYETARRNHVNSFEDMLVVSINMKAITPSGVLTSLLPCYSTPYNDHNVNVGLSYNAHNCYSTYCPQETEKPINIPAPEVEDLNILKRSWIEQWSIERQELVGLHKHVIELQSRIYDLIKKQYDFLIEANHLVNVIGKGFLENNDMDMIVYPEKKDLLYYKMFATSIPLLESHRKYLFEPMKEILFKQGKYIKLGIYSLYRTWTKDCFVSYIEYIDSLAETVLFIDFEKMKKHSDFIDWLDTFPLVPLAPSKLLSNYFFYNLIQYKDSLKDIKKRTLQSDPEMDNLNEAIEIISIFCDKINERLGAAEVHALFRRFAWKITPSNFNIELKPSKIVINVKEKVLRKSGIGRWSSATYFLILMSNSIFLTELDLDTRQFKVIEKPIPVELIGYEIPNASEFEEEGRLVARNEPDKKVTDSLRIIHLGQKNSWTLKMSSFNSRTLWIGYIKNAKQAINDERASMFHFNAVLTEMPFATNTKSQIYSFPSSYPVIQASNNYIHYSVCPSNVRKILTMASFVYQSKVFYSIGTTVGLFMRSNQHPWVQIDKLINITQLEYIEEAQLLLILADKKFLQVACEDLLSCYHSAPSTLPTIKLSNQSVDLFGSGFIDNELTIFYMKVKINASATPYKSFKVLCLDPKRRSLKTHATFDKFFLAVDCYGWSTFNSSVIMQTEKGFFMLDAELIPTIIPRVAEVKLPNVQSKEANFFRMLDQRVCIEKPLNAFSINNGKEILTVFSTFAAFCNERGFLSRVKLLEFNTKAEGAILKDNLLFLISKFAIEVFDITEDDSSMYPKTFITGENFELIPNATNGKNNLVIMASHPSENSKMLLELI